jgi:Ran-interacting Mog1 protein
MKAKPLAVPEIRTFNRLHLSLTSCQQIKKNTMESIVTRQLFGGAVELSMPARMIDISDFRQIPDNQEVYTDANEDQSLIVEFVEHHDVPNQEAGEFFFNDLATANSAAHAAISSTSELRHDSVPGLPEDTYCSLIIGQQSIGKSRQESSALNKIHVQLLIVRLPEYKTDMLVTLNTPIFISEHSAAAKEAGAGYKELHMQAPELFQNMCRSLKILDFKLFG